MTHFTVIKNGLVPRDDDARTLMAKQHIGATVEIEILQLQDAAYRRYVFMVIGRVAKALDISAEDMRAGLLVETGRFRLVKLRDGKFVMVVQSMHRRSMSTADMHSFFADAKTIIITEILPAIDPLAAGEISEMLNTGVATNGQN